DCVPRVARPVVARSAPARSPPSGQPRRHHDARRAHLRAAPAPRRRAAGRRAGHAGRVLLVHDLPLRPALAGQAAHRPVLRAAAREPGPARRGPGVPPRRVRGVRAVHAAPQGGGDLRRADVEPGLVRPALGLHHPGAVREGEALRVRLRQRCGRAVHRRRGARVLRGHPGAAVPVHRRRRHPDHGAARLGLLQPADRPARHLRGELRAAAARGDAQPRRRRLLRPAPPVAPRPDLRAVRVRRDRDARPGPDLDARAGRRAGAAAGAVHPDLPRARQTGGAATSRAGLGRAGPRPAVAARRPARVRRPEPDPRPAHPAGAPARGRRHQRGFVRPVGRDL
ncbi:MAG: Twin-arginine translocation protein TatC, partial [uncultured Actinomycetospora sp.]